MSAPTAETAYLGSRKAKVWTYLILGLVLVICVVAANFAITNPETARDWVNAFLGLPDWAFPAIAAGLGAFIYWLGLRNEADWPEALGALLIAGAVLGFELLIGWSHFQFGWFTAFPYVLPFVIFIVLMLIGLRASR
jgi:uncharacterized integral membrane protein